MRFLPLAALLATLVFTSQAGAVGWVTSRALSRPDREALAPKVAVTPSGERVIAWQQVVPGAVSSAPEGIGVRVAPPGGDFGAAQLLPDATASAPTLVTGGDDNVGIAWVGGDKLHVARRAPGAAAFTEGTPLQLP